jgi:hypothetical protein
MPEPLIHVARGEAELGTFTLAETEELVEAGFLQSTDDAWSDRMPEWRPLRETLPRLKAASADWRDKVVAGATLLSRVVGRRAGRLVATVKSQAADGQQAPSQAKQLALEQYLPQFQKLLAQQLRDKPAAVLQAAVQDESVMRNVFGALYDCLPKPLCRFVPGSLFVSFCMEHRQRLFAGAVASATSGESASSSFAANPPSDDAPRA